MLHELFNKGKNYRAASSRGVRTAGNVLDHRLLAENQLLKTSKLCERQGASGFSRVVQPEVPTLADMEPR